MVRSRVIKQNIAYIGGRISNWRISFFQMAYLYFQIFQERQKTDYLAEFYFLFFQKFGKRCHTKRQLVSTITIKFFYKTIGNIFILRTYNL